MTADTGTVNTKKMRALIKSKLIELDALVDEELPDYVMIMVANKKPHDQMTRDLQLFLQDNTESFTSWLTSLVYPEGTPEVTALVTPDSSSKLAAADAGEQSLELTAESDEFADELCNDTVRAARSVAQASSKLTGQPTTAATLTQEAQRDTWPASTTTRPKAETNGKLGVPVQSVLTVPHKSRITLNRDALRSTGDHQPRQGRSRSRSRDRPVDLRSKLTAARNGPTVQNNEHGTDKLQHTTHTSKSTAAIKPMPQTAAKTPNSVPASDALRPGLITVSLSPEDLKLLMDAKSSRPIDSLAHHESERKTTSHAEPQFFVTLNGSQRTVADVLSHPQPQPCGQDLDEAIGIIHASDTDTVHKPAQCIAQLPVSCQQPFNTATWNTQSGVPTFVSNDHLLPDQPSILAPRPLSMTITAVSGTHYVTTTERASNQPVDFNALADTQMQPLHLSNPARTRPRALAPGDLRAKLCSRKRRAFDSNPTLAHFVDADSHEKQRFTVNLCDDDDDNERADAEYPGATDNIAETSDNCKAKPASGKSAPAGSERCRFWPACMNGDECPYVHPSEPCRNFPACSFGDRCLFVHPTCKFDANCTRPDCPYSHGSRHTPAPTAAGVIPTPASGTDAVACRFFPNCFNPQCTYYHPQPQSPAPLDGAVQPRRCMYGSFCPNKAFCKFSHEPQSRSQPVPNRTLFKWVGTKTSSANTAGSAPPEAEKESPSAPAATLGKTVQHPSVDAPKRARVEQRKPDSDTPGEHDLVVAQ